MEKILVTAGQFAGVVGELVNGSVVIEIFGRECNIGCQEYVAQNKPVNMVTPVIYDRTILEIRHSKHGVYS